MNCKNIQLVVVCLFMVSLAEMEAVGSPATKSKIEQWSSEQVLLTKRQKKRRKSRRRRRSSGSPNASGMVFKLGTPMALFFPVVGGDLLRKIDPNLYYHVGAYASYLSTEFISVFSIVPNGGVQYRKFLGRKTSIGGGGRLAFSIAFVKSTLPSLFGLEAESTSTTTTNFSVLPYFFVDFHSSKSFATGIELQTTLAGLSLPMIFVNFSFN
jgi:hypothetical protein